MMSEEKWTTLLVYKTNERSGILWQLSTHIKTIKKLPDSFVLDIWLFYIPDPAKGIYKRKR